MKISLTALIISLSLHGSILFLAYSLGDGIGQPDKPIRIDFTINDSAPGPPSPEATRPPSPKPPGLTSPKMPQRALQSALPRLAANRPRIAESKPLDRPAAPLAPATEKAGPVFIEATRRETLPVPGASYSNEEGSTGGGQGTAAHGSIGGGDDGSGGGGGGGGVEQIRSKYRKEHFEYIRRIIQEHIVYPPRAQWNFWQGKVVVMFCVMHDGKVKDIRIRESSGFDILDKNVIETIRKVEPFPKPPVAVVLTIPIEYRL